MTTQTRKTDPTEPEGSQTRRARAIMILGTSSHAGKSTVAAAFCRSLARKGLNVAPFKAQNMSLNSWVTPEGAEIGRAQAQQAQAAGIEPHADMNPLLLKPCGGNMMQVVALGKPVGNFSGREYYQGKAEMRGLVHAAYDRLAARFDVVVLEGAGSPAEINLRDEDLVNGSMAEYAEARCILVADIERGGVFASILGTVSLLPERHRKLLAGVVINKFRGDASLLDSGIHEIEGLTGVPVLGVLPYLDDLGLDEEDSQGLEDSPSSRASSLDIAVIRLRYLSNFTDFQPLQREAGVSVRYVDRPSALGNPDLIIIPGSKNVRHDADFLRDSGLARSLRAAAERNVPILGICGGFQILGTVVRDPYGVEGPPGETAGLGLLSVETVLEREKELSKVEAENLGFPFLAEGAACAGYEIHMGRTTPIDGNGASGTGAPLLRLLRKNGDSLYEAAGFKSVSNPIFGCYLHGLFESPAVRIGLFRWLSGRKGLDWREAADTVNPEAMDSAGLTGPPGESRNAGAGGLDRIADALEAILDPVRLLQDNSPIPQNPRPRPSK
jgi:adenosylcobyric acid synthase